MKKRRKNVPESEGLCYIRGRVVQVRCNQPMVKLHLDNRRNRAPQENSLRILWIPHWLQTTCLQSLQTRILLANGAEGRSAHSENMPSMSNDGPEVLQTFGVNSADTSDLTPSKMGNRPSGTSTHSPGQLQVCSSCC